MEQLNSDLLRTFLAIANAGSVTEGATRIFRSQSAASLQIRKLEDILGTPVFARHGRGVVLTGAGERLLPVAQDISRTLDAAYRDLTSDDLHGKLRLGIPDDQSRETMSQIVAGFAQSHPLVELDITCALSSSFPDTLASGALDLAIYEAAQPTPDREVLRQEQTCWMVSRHHDLLSRETIPVALFDRDCWWRDSALEALQALGRPFRIAYSSQSEAGVAAAIDAGFAIGLLGETSFTSNLRRLGAADGFGDMPVSNLVLATSKESCGAAVEAMQRAIRQAFTN